jgi:hypothetical protein
MLIPRWITTYETRILIQQQNLYVLPYTELIRRKSKDAVRNTTLDVNNITFMFNEIRYELHDIEINHSTNIRLCWRTTWAYSERKVRRWKTQIGNMKIIINTGTVHKATTITLLFCEDYKRVVMHENYEIKIIKISNNITFIFATEDTMNKIFELGYCINHMFSWLSGNVFIINNKYARFVEIVQNLDDNFFEEYPLIDRDFMSKSYFIWWVSRT